MSANMPSRRSPLLALLGLGLLLALTLALLLPAPTAAMEPTDPDYAAHMEKNAWSAAHRAAARQVGAAEETEYKRQQLGARLPDRNAEYKNQNANAPAIKKAKEGINNVAPTNSGVGARRAVVVRGKKMMMLAMAERARAQQQGTLSPMGAKEEESRLSDPFSLLSTASALGVRNPATVPVGMWPACLQLQTPPPLGHMGPIPPSQHVAAVRAAIRGGPGDTLVPVPTAANPSPSFFQWYINGGNYPSRVEGVSFDVVRGGQSDPGDRASVMCAVLWNPTCASGAWWENGGDHSYTPVVWHRGHIWAAFLGGSNDDPMNFIPLHHLSNSNGGVWQRIERMAGALKDAYENRGGTGAAAFNACQVRVDIRFTGWMAGGYVPSQGTYRVSITEACYGLPWTGPNSPQNVWTTGATFQSEPVKAFFEHQQAEGLGISRRRYVEVTWYNQQDIAIPAPPALQPITQPGGRYRVVPNLYNTGTPVRN